LSAVAAAASGNPFFFFSPQPPHFLLTHGKTKNLSNIFWIPYFSYFRMRLLKIFSVEVGATFSLV